MVLTEYIKEFAWNLMREHIPNYITIISIFQCARVFVVIIMILRHSQTIATKEIGKKKSHRSWREHDTLKGHRERLRAETGSADWWRVLTL